MSYLLLFFLAATTGAFEGAVSKANGGAGAATIEASETPFQNPAGISHLVGYHFSSGYSVQNLAENSKSSTWAFSILDNLKDTVVPTSLAYAQSKFQQNEDPLEDYLVRELRISFAGFIKKKWSLGFALIGNENRYLEKSWSQYNLAAGLIHIRNSSWGLGIYINNALPPKKEIPDQVRQEQTATLGTTINYLKYIRLKADLKSASNLNFSKPTISAGVETYSNDWLIFRLGVQRNFFLESTLASTGLSFSGPRFGLHYGYLMNTDQNQQYSHAIDLTIPVW